MSLAVGEVGSATVNIADNDGVYTVALGTQSKRCSVYTEPPTCDKTFSILYTTAGTYTLEASATDKWSNPCEQTSTLTVHVTDPCADNPPDCDDQNPCTTDRCVVINGAATCSNEAVTDGQTCGGVSKCEGGICKAPCVNPYLCADTQPTHSTLVDQYYCTGASQCYTCADGFHPEGEACVADTTCQDECPSDGAVGCLDSTHNQTCADWDGDGCLEWGGVQACPAGTTCAAGACVTSCQDACTDGATRCNGNTLETCGHYGSTCTSWHANTPCADPTPYCVEDGAAACVACRTDEDCAPSETCVGGACIAAQACQAASDCTENPYATACSNADCVEGACSYSPTNNGATCTLPDGSTGACVNGQCEAACTASPGCVASQPAHASQVAGWCAAGACYQCAQGFSWDGSACVANCQPSCPPDGSGFAEVRQCPHVSLAWQGPKHTRQVIPRAG